MKITCLHTAQSHVESMTRLFTKHGWDGALELVVRPDLLARAQSEGVDAVAQDVSAVLEQCGDADAVLCTCSTLGALVESSGTGKQVRIDRPAMEEAASYRNVMLAVCLESTRGPSVALFEDCAKGRTPDVVFCEGAWSAPETDCIVLAQASMQGAAPYLMDIGVPVLTTPALAVRRAIRIARR